MADFDWETLMENLSEFDRLDLTPEEENRLQTTLEGIFDWAMEPLTGQRSTTSKKLEMIGRRMVALCWVIGPSRFGDDPSARQVAKSIGCHYAVFSELTAELSRKFGVRNRHQLHGGNFKAAVTHCNSEEKK